jgi:hypothetical protein
MYASSYSVVSRKIVKSRAFTRRSFPVFRGKNHIVLSWHRVSREEMGVKTPQDGNAPIMGSDRTSESIPPTKKGTFL